MKLLADEDVMAVLEIKDKRTLRKYRRTCGLDFIKVGRYYKYTQEMIDSFIYRNSSTYIKAKRK